MQIDTDIVAFIAGPLTALATTAIGYGVLKAKVDRLERDMDRAKEEFVTAAVFQATIAPITEDLHEIKADVKKIILHFMKCKNFEENTNEL